MSPRRRTSRCVLGSLGLQSGGGFATHQLTHYRWLDILLGLAGGFLLTAGLTICFAAWYLDHLGRDSPVLWDGYGFWFGALAVSLLPVVWLRDRTPAFAGALLAGVCGSSLLLVVVLWLLDNGVGFSA